MLINLNDIFEWIIQSLPILLGLLGFVISLATFIANRHARMQDARETELQKVMRMLEEANALVVVLQKQLLDKDAILAIALRLLGIQNANELEALNEKFERGEMKRRRPAKK